MLIVNTSECSIVGATVIGQRRWGRAYRTSSELPLLSLVHFFSLLHLTSYIPNMPPESTPSKGGGMMSLYANLLDPSAESAPGTISRAPVVFKQSDDAQADESAAKKQQLNPGTSEFTPSSHQTQ